ncbi:cupin domain-containing protein [Sulfurovum sp.]|jgi:cupin 2 domain-containing protein|uniref:cupin domain-containing protein n=1 Tax=Sulfurovum sp. TaxID=1969726 RepID=UPI002A35FE5F|nr:cupin domain-containing protein [Sulfurovum sp.]MDD2451171.1 cupin domain-containing protein [Sulfurovum sp.]MDD3591881.1 cupin domain-containing protein [Sulfurovum sp.]MDY0403945.1 cupin domain-containing protein [Sulfurovum sp.]
MNFFDYEIPTEGESFTTLFENDRLTVSRIVSSDRLEPKLYCQEVDEWVILLEGAATLRIETELKTLNRGEFLHIPAHTAHEVVATKQGTLWLALYIAV